MRKTYYKQIYETCAVEGNHFNYVETVGALKEGKRAAGRSENDFFEILGMRDAYSALPKCGIRPGNIRIEVN